MKTDYKISDTVTLEHHVSWRDRDDDEWFYLNVSGNEIKIDKKQAEELLIKTQPKNDLRWYVDNDDRANAIRCFHKNFKPNYPTTTTSGIWGKYSRGAIIYEDERIAKLDWKKLRIERLNNEKEKTEKILSEINRELKELQDG